MKSWGRIEGEESAIEMGRIEIVREIDSVHSFYTSIFPIFSLLSLLSLSMNGFNINQRLIGCDCKLMKQSRRLDARHQKSELARTDLVTQSTAFIIFKNAILQYVRMLPEDAKKWG